MEYMFITDSSLSGYSRCKNRTVHEIVRLLCDKDEEVSEELQGLTALNLFVVVSGKPLSCVVDSCGSIDQLPAFHSVIFSQHMSLSLSASARSLIEQGLDRWLQAWEARLQPVSPADIMVQSPTNILQLDGIARHAPEYQVLAKARLDLFQNQATSSKDLFKASIELDNPSLGQIV